MKRTKSMYINPSIESEEIAEYAISQYSYQLGVLARHPEYRHHNKLDTMQCMLANQIKSVVENLHKKYNKGVFDADKAIDAFYYVANTAAECYHTEYHYKATVTERFNAAVYMVNSLMDAIKSGVFEF